MSRKKCLICAAKMTEVDYKDIATLGRYMDRWNKIQPASRNYNCAKHQRQVERAVKRARFLALMPFTIR